MGETSRDPSLPSRQQQPADPAAVPDGDAGVAAELAAYARRMGPAAPSDSAEADPLQRQAAQQQQ